MKNILGLDLGSSSIGWAVIRENSEEQELVAMGSRVVSLTAAELSSFTQGKIRYKAKLPLLSRNI